MESGFQSDLEGLAEGERCHSLTPGCAERYGTLQVLFLIARLSEEEGSHFYLG